MTDLISREALRQAMYHEAMESDTDEQRWDSGCWIRYKMFERVLESMPSVQQEIIRCKDCDNYQTDWIPESVPDRRYCATMDSMMPKDGYCSYAERRTDG